MILKASMIAAIAMAVSSVGLLAPAHAEFVISIDQSGNNVVATGSGTIDVSGLQYYGTTSSVGQELWPSIPFIGLGSEGTVTEYGGFSADGTFGSGGYTSDSATSGDEFYLNGRSIDPVFGVPSTYVSGSYLSDTATYDNQTIASLGLTPGTYVYTWNTGASTTDGIEIVVAGAAISAAPEPSTWVLMIAGLGAVGLGLRRRKQAVGSDVKIRFAA